MSSFIHRFGRQQPVSQFEDWPSSPVARLVPASFLPTKDAPVLPVQDDLPSKTQNDSLNIIIGLGETGEHVVRQWLKQLSHDPNDTKRWLRACIIGQGEGDPLPETPVPVQRLNLTDDSDFLSSVSYRAVLFENQRGSVLSLFRTLHNLTWFKSWFDGCLRDPVSNIKVFIIASVADPIIGLLGDILQIIRLQPGQNTPSKNVSALLTFQTQKPENSLEDGETYAVLREIARMTIGGIHKLQPLIGSTGDVFRSALLDHIFFIGTGSGFPGALDLTDTPFTDGVGQALTEILFTLIHPTADLIWQYLKHSRQPGTALVHTAGIATLFVPVTEIQNYVAARLVRAVLFGERHDRTGEGLLAQSDQLIDYQDKAPILAYRWLTEGPCGHPFFLWLLEINTPTGLQPLPEFEVREFVAAFQAQIAYGLSAFLNDPVEVDKLKQSGAALEWLETHLRNLNRWLTSDQTVTPNSPDRINFQDFLHLCQTSLADLIKQVQEWEEVVQYIANRAGSGNGIGEIPNWRSTRMPRSLNMDWRRQASQRSADWRTLRSTPDGIADDRAMERIPDLLNNRVEDAEKQLVQSSDGRIRRALIARGSRAMKEVENFYRDTVRPELTHPGLDNSNTFNRLRERLAWLVKAVPDQRPKLSLVCLPPGCSGVAISDDICYMPQDAEKVITTLHDVAVLLVRGHKTDLTGNWFRKQLPQAVSFLARSALPLLEYEHEGNASPLYYLIGNTNTTGRYRHIVFQNQRNMVSEIVGEEGRFTALTLWDTISLNSVEYVKTAYSEYRPHQKLHLYPQERAAVVYESYFQRVLNLRSIVIPPELTLMLADPQLVTLFFQALLGGLITPRAGSDGDRFWTLLPIGEFDYLPLAFAKGISDGRGLVEALRQFALEKPNDPRAKRELNPAEHFGQEREKFKEALHLAAYQRRNQPEFPQCNKQLLAQIEKWINQKDNAMLRALAAILAVERLVPVWRRWKEIEETD